MKTNTRGNPNTRILGTGHPTDVPLLREIVNIEAVHPDVILPLLDVANIANTTENTRGLMNTADRDTPGVVIIDDQRNITGTMSTRDIVNILGTEEPMNAFLLMNSRHFAISQELMNTVTDILPGIRLDIHPAQIGLNVLHPIIHFFHHHTGRISVPEMVDAHLLMTVLHPDHVRLQKVQLHFYHHPHPKDEGRLCFPKSLLIGAILPNGWYPHPSQWGVPHPPPST